jgi:hypothetical protein
MSTVFPGFEIYLNIPMLKVKTLKKPLVLKKRARNPYGQKTLIVDTSCVNIHHCKLIACRFVSLQMFSTFSLLQYCYAVITEICAHLNISCFTITPKQTKEESSTKEGKAS